jgi:diaminohydroxyphosphoribosylaminopyrimidine deaminase/5-amino-6-(5-phosphoribosylamino)uracil reductase
VVAGLESAKVPAALRETGAEVLTLPADASGRGVDLDLLLRRLADLEINEIQVEAGSRLCGSLLQGGWVDELLIYQAPVLLGDGGPPAIELGRLERMSDRVSFEVVESRAIGTDLRLRLLPAHHSTRAG